MSDSTGEKTEEASDKKVEDSRKKGQVWKSRDLTGVAVFAAGLGVVKATWDRVEQEIQGLFAYGFEKLAHPHDLERAIPAMMMMGLTSLMVLTIPVVVAAALVGALTDFLQVGPLLTKDPLQPKLDKLNPVQGFKNLFSKKQFVELIKSTLKLSISGYVVYGGVRDSLGLVAISVRGNAMQTVQALAELVWVVSIRITILFLVFSIFDVWWQRRSYMKELMMTKDEVKREYKDSEGDPHHKAKRKEMHMEILEGAQMEAVRGADVVVTNPDHVAVALKYDRDKDGAPRVIAKALDAQAQALKAIAAEADVPMMRNIPLAHALLRVELGQEVPEGLYDGVAEVLNWVYGLQASA
jgi:flagellar biosynthesis protein FlhB